MNESKKLILLIFKNGGSIFQLAKCLLYTPFVPY